MPKTKFPPSILSRPVYGILEVRPGKHHLMIADDEGAEAILDFSKSAPSDLWNKTHIIFISNKTGVSYCDQLRALTPSQMYVGPSYAAANQHIDDTLAKSHMGLQVYLSGTESAMGQAMSAVISAGIPHTAIQTEHRGSTARRMQCVHCKGMTEDVTTDPFVCSHCGLNLYVRDHYSRRLAAFQGVCVDAEEPGNVPAQVELFK
ncbi:MAG: hypothetical protein JKX91_03680 [Rhizobiaceae bacterium]|nr:hypothetical protein [Rhizobiaceae bacterium]